MFYFMDIFYALGLNIIKKVCVKYGQTDELEKKFCSFDEVVSLMQQAVKEPDHSGNYHDFIELCKLYDKNENGTIMLAELDNFLNLLGKFLNVSRFKSVFFLLYKELTFPASLPHILNTNLGFQVPHNVNFRSVNFRASLLIIGRLFCLQKH